LWRRHCRAHLPAPEAAELVSAAEEIGARLQWMIAHHGPQARPPATETEA
jgi:hypothetical protein